MSMRGVAPPLVVCAVLMEVHLALLKMCTYRL